MKSKNFPSKHMLWRKQPFFLVDQKHPIIVFLLMKNPHILLNVRECFPSQTCWGWWFHIQQPAINADAIWCLGDGNIFFWVTWMWGCIPSDFYGFSWFYLMSKSQCQNQTSSQYRLFYHSTSIPSGNPTITYVKSPFWIVTSTYKRPCSIANS